MSNFVYGYAIIDNGVESVFDIKKILELKYSIGIYIIDNDELIGFPDEKLPPKEAFKFMIGDNKKSKNAQKLIDLWDYDPDASGIELPVNGKQRLKILTDCINDLFTLFNATKVFLAITDWDELEEEKYLSRGSLYKTLLNDCDLHSPFPSCLYIIDGEMKSQCRAVPKEKGAK